jgi:hypothetical protein
VSPDPLMMTDWKTSKLRDRLRRGVPEFNYNNNPLLLREDEIDYLISMIRNNRQEIYGSMMYKPIFEKATATLERLMSDEELCVPHLFSKIKDRLAEQTPETTLRLLLRCRMMFDCRG